LQLILQLGSEAMLYESDHACNIREGSVDRIINRRKSTLVALLTALIAAGALGGTPREALAFSASENSVGSIFNQQSPAVVTDQSRNPLIDDDFLRLIYVPHGLQVTTLGKPSQTRTFFGNSRFYSPPITPAQIADYAGGLTNPASDMVAMRCQPANTDEIDPELAIWPNVAKFLADDLPPAASCPGSSTSDQAWCLAKAFDDTPNQPLILSLYNAISFGKDVFSINNFDGGNLLFDYYGIGSGHSGLGFVVKGSANVSLTAAQTLQNSVVPEYLLKNVTLAEADCRCVQVPSYNGRDATPLSPTFIWNQGRLTNGACRTVKRILTF
jgi:hypothetical protein